MYIMWEMTETYECITSDLCIQVSDDFSYGRQRETESRRMVQYVMGDC